MQHFFSRRPQPLITRPRAIKTAIAVSFNLMLTIKCAQTILPSFESFLRPPVGLRATTSGAHIWTREPLIPLEVLCHGTKTRICRSEATRKEPAKGKKDGLVVQSAMRYPKGRKRN